MKPSILAVMLMSLLPLWTRADLNLCDSGHSDYVIVCEGRSFETFGDQRGANELRSYIAEMTGVRLPILLCVGEMPEHAIIVGVNRYSKALGVKLDPSLGDDGFVMKSIGNRIVLAGPGKRGSMYACFALLEKMGVRWYTSNLTHVPRQSTIAIPELNERQSPDFEYREPFFVEAMEPDFCAHLRCNSSWAPLDAGFGGKIKYSPHFCHTFHRFIPEGMFADHPEYFPLIDGKRVSGGRQVQLCLSNPDVLRITIETVNRWIDEDPEGMIFSVSQNDNEKYCQCDNCKKLIEQYGAPSGEYLWFVNQVADAVAKKHPKAMIDMLAYKFTEKPPRGIAPRDNVRIRLCPITCCEAHPYEQCTAPQNEAFLRHLRKWSEITNNLYIWHYNTDYLHALMPFPDFNQFPDSIRLYKRSGVKGIFFEGERDPGGGPSDAELRSYVMAHLLWDSKRDVNQLINEWMEGVYGPELAKVMRQWFDLVHAQVKDPEHHLYVYDSPKPEIFTPQMLEDGERILSNAATLAANDRLALQFVKKVQLDLRYVKLVQNPTKGKELDQFLDDVNSFGIQYLRELRPIDFWLKDYLKKVDAKNATTTPKP